MRSSGPGCCGKRCEAPQPPIGSGLPDYQCQCVPRDCHIIDQVVTRHLTTLRPPVSVSLTLTHRDWQSRGVVRRNVMPVIALLDAPTRSRTASSCWSHQPLASTLLQVPPLTLSFWVRVSFKLALAGVCHWRYDASVFDSFVGRLWTRPGSRLTGLDLWMRMMMGQTTPSTQYTTRTMASTRTPTLPSLAA